MSSYARKIILQTKLFLGLLLALIAAMPAFAGSAPEWLKTAAKTPLPNYSDETRGVLLLDEKTVTVSDTGEIHTFHRRAFKILRTQGRDLGMARVYYDNDTKLSNFKAWSISAQGIEYEVKDKDAIEVTAFDGSLYGDSRYKFLKIPASDPGSVVGYEYEQKERPYVLQNTWWFQEDIPVRKARFTAVLPNGWEMQTQWLNSERKEPRVIGNSQTWELEDVPPMKKEPGMPAFRAVIARMESRFLPLQASLQSKAITSWNDVGAWYSQLAAAQAQVTPEIQQKSRELTQGKVDALQKLKALATFMQRNIRYVAIEIGIGGFQPHTAQDVFANRYGDCKDKVTLLKALLHDSGLESYYVLIHTERGVVAKDFPSANNFNHVIIAVPLPKEVPVEGLYSTMMHPRLGRLIFFDPTDDMTPVGRLPSAEQGNYGLLVTENGGELLKMPMQPPDSNQLVRTAKLSLSPSGTLSGEVREIRTGSSAVHYRALMLAMQAPQRISQIENFLGTFLTAYKVTDFKVENLEDFDKDVVIRYSFEASNYAKNMSGLLLVRPRVFGDKADLVVDLKDRKYGLDLGAPTMQSDDFEIALPTGFTVDELPPPQKLASAHASYTSQSSVEGNVLRYKRQYQVLEVIVPRESLKDLNEVNRRILADERNSVVLRKVSQ